MKWMLNLGIIATMLSGCNMEERERTVQKKEAELAIIEQQLNDREQALKHAESEFEKKQIVDSTHSDSAYLYSNNVLGQWNTKMVCTQTTCSGSAIGDIKLETWNFSYENAQVVARVAVDNKLTRIYAGNVFSNSIELVENIEPTSKEPATKIIIRLKKQNDRMLEGQREILRPDCKIVYTLQLTR